MRPSVLLTALSSVAMLSACIGSDDEGDHCDEDGHCEEETDLYEAAYAEGQEPGKDDGTDCSGVRVPDRNGFNKRIALTFDDGPNPATTPTVLETLRRHNAPAAFFINGKRLANAQAKAIAAEVAADPLFILANHSQNHSDLATLPIDKVKQEMDRTAALVTEAGETMRYFRFPFGSSTATRCARSRTGTGSRRAGTSTAPTGASRPAAVCARRRRSSTSPTTCATA